MEKRDADTDLDLYLEGLVSMYSDAPETSTPIDDLISATFGSSLEELAVSAATTATQRDQPLPVLSPESRIMAENLELLKWHRPKDWERILLIMYCGSDDSDEGNVADVVGTAQDFSTNMASNGAEQTSKQETVSDLSAKTFQQPKTCQPSPEPSHSSYNGPARGSKVSKQPTLADSRDISTAKRQKTVASLPDSPQSNGSLPEPSTPWWACHTPNATPSTPPQSETDGDPTLDYLFNNLDDLTQPALKHQDTAKWQQKDAVPNTPVSTAKRNYTPARNIQPAASKPMAELNVPEYVAALVKYFSGLHLQQGAVFVTSSWARFFVWAHSFVACRRWIQGEGHNQQFVYTCGASFCPYHCELSYQKGICLWQVTKFAPHGPNCSASINQTRQTTHTRLIRSITKHLFLYMLPQLTREVKCETGTVFFARHSRGYKLKRAMLAMTEFECEPDKCIALLAVAFEAMYDGCTLWAGKC